MTPFQMYLLLKLDGFIILSTLISILSFLIVLILLIYCLDEYDLEKSFEKIKKKIIIFSIICLISMAVAVLTPSTKEMTAILVAPKIINNEKVQKIPPKLLELLDVKLDDLLEEVKQEKENVGCKLNKN